jgi:uncharacterized membrane protein (UPF0127 family)
MSAPHFLVPALAASGRWGLKVELTGLWLATDAELAGSSKSRRRGLLGQEGLPHGRALVIAPTQGVHTFGMRFDIDIVGVSRTGVVVSIREAVPRRRVVLSWRAFAMVELATGAAKGAGLTVGDKLVASTDSIPQSWDICPALGSFSTK